MWDLARLAWALRGDITTTTVPIGEFTGSDSGSVVVWDEDSPTSCSRRSNRTHPCRRMCSTPEPSG